MSEQTIWKALAAKGLNDYAIAGVMGNMYYESGLLSNNVENRSGIDDAFYTQAVNNGTIAKTTFMYDSYGYGLCQWTFWSRKQGLYDLAKQRNVSIDNEPMQIDYLMQELKSGYTSTLATLQNAKSVQEASDAFLFNFERPANASAQSARRAQQGQVYYNRFHGSAQPATQPATTPAASTHDGMQEWCVCTLPVLKPGTKGAAVVMAQRGLACYCAELGVNLGSTGPNHDGVDGVFGEKMQEAVRAFQKHKALAITGTIAKATWEALMK